MFAKVLTGSLFGIEPELTVAEIDLAAGLPGLTTVGLPDISVKEAKDRIRAAVTNAGFKFPAKRITVNLSPANKKKEGTHYDLPIAIGILCASGQIKGDMLRDYALIGELSLDGRINAVRGALPLVIGLRKNGVQKIILPAGNIREAAMIEGVGLYPAASLSQLAEALAADMEPPRYTGGERHVWNAKPDIADFADVAGQDGVKRAMQIAASAQHNLMMLGPPGAGKTMMAKRLAGILPSMTYEEKLEVTQIYSIAGELEDGGGIIEHRPFRAPHHTVSPVALVGGGRSPRPGEVSLAHHGVLFLDELPEFNRYALEMLRQPVEDEKVTLTRVAGTYTYPSKCMLALSMNPCPCGFFGSLTRECTCMPGQIQRYLSKLSSPLLDRIDIQLEVFPVAYHELAGGQKHKSSGQMRQEVEQARTIQLERYRKENILYNSQLNANQMSRYCKLDQKSEALLETAFQKLSLSARAYTRIIKLSRTIADLEGRAEIQVQDVAEAIQYRSLDKKYRNL